MAKKIIAIRIEPELHEEVKKRGINLSAFIDSVLAPLLGVVKPKRSSKDEKSK